MESSMIVYSMANLCYEARSLIAILAMVLFICAAATYIISSLLQGKWKKGLCFFSIILVMVGIAFIILYLAVPTIISWLIGPEIVFDDPCAYDPYYESYPRYAGNCTTGSADCIPIMR
jgi:hypothetical protein